jgi:hypothetical protein
MARTPMSVAPSSAMPRRITTGPLPRCCAPGLP